jgi:hypothetical protein
MGYGCDKSFGNVGTSDALVQGEGRLELPNTYGTLIRWPVEKKCGSYDRVVEPAGSERLFRTASPDDGISFPEI